MTGLIAFLNARLDEDESRARATERPGGPPWSEVGRGERIPEMAHIERHDPARVLREVEAKRRITAEIARGVEYEAEPLADMVLRFLALPYGDHPDYREEWKP